MNFFIFREFSTKFQETWFVSYISVEMASKTQKSASKTQKSASKSSKKILEAQEIADARQRVKVYAEKNPLFDQYLVGAVQARPLIWDSNLEDYYKHRQNRNPLYEDVAKQLVEDDYFDGEYIFKHF